MRLYSVLQQWSTTEIALSLSENIAELLKEVVQLLLLER